MTTTLKPDWDGVTHALPSIREQEEFKRKADEFLRSRGQRVETWQEARRRKLANLPWGTK